jgi:hypothetical protein
MKTAATLILLYMVAAFAAGAGYITNIVWLFNHAASSSATVELVLALLGIFAAPLGALHGFYLWF